MTLIPFAEWRPDVAQLNGKFSPDVVNVLVGAASYIPAQSFASLSSALAAEPFGAFCARRLNGTLYIFAGTAEKLYLFDKTSGGWTDVSQAGVTYAANETAQWDFAQFGDYVVAVNQNDNPQVFQIGTDSAFSDLAGSPPKAGTVKVWGDFLALMNLADNPNRIQWSALNDITGWTPGADNSDYQDFPDGGIVQGSSEATNPIIFLERAIYRATFVPGSVEIFTFQKIHDMRGAKSAKSIASRGSFVFYADEGGFFQIGSDGTLSGIGFEKVDKTIFSQLESVDAANITGAVDPFYSRVYWAADVNGVGYYDRMFVYDWNIQKWTQVDIRVKFFVPIATPGYTLEQLDDISSSLDDLEFSLDSKAWQAGAPVLAALDDQYRLGTFTGLALEASITTQETGDTAGQMMRVRECYPIVDTDKVHVSYGVRNRRSDNVTWLPEQVPSSNTGIVRKNARGRFFRFKTRIESNQQWTHAQGIDVTSEPAGYR